MSSSFFSLPFPTSLAGAFCSIASWEGRPGVFVEFNPCAINHLCFNQMTSTYSRLSFATSSQLLQSFCSCNKTSRPSLHDSRYLQAFPRSCTSALLFWTRRQPLQQETNKCPLCLTPPKSIP